MSISTQLMHSSNLNLIHVIGLPRSMGTALHMALSQAPEVDGQLNEPFYYPDLKGREWTYRPSEEAVRTFEDGCRHIWEKYQNIQANADTEVTLVVHDLSQDLSDIEFKNMSQIAGHVVLVTRDPILNAMSMFTRYVNDKVAQPGGDKLSLGECLSLMKDEESFRQFFQENPLRVDTKLLAKLLEKEDVVDEDFPAARKKVIDIFRFEYLTAWKNMLKFIEIARENLSSREFTVFDSSKLTEDVEENLRSLVDRISGLTFTPDMMNDWSKFAGKEFDCIITKNWGDFAHINAWNGPVRNSKGLKPKTSFAPKIPVEEFPSEVRPDIRSIIEQYNLFTI